jgi:hypothetical protein
MIAPTSEGSHKYVLPLILFITVVIPFLILYHKYLHGITLPLFLLE